MQFYTEFLGEDGLNLEQTLIKQFEQIWSFETAIVFLISKMQFIYTRVYLTDKSYI